jgi:hypothetical protein
MKTNIMIKLLNIRLLPLVCFLLTIGVISSCEKDTSKTGDVVLLSFGPTGASHGDTLRFFGHNLNRVTAIDFSGTGASVPQSAFLQQSSELILVKVPNEAIKGFVRLKTPEGEIVSKTQFNLSVNFKVATMTAQARPGEHITLTGDFMNWVRSVTFERNKVVTSFVSQTLNQLVVKVPDDAQTGPLVIAYAGTDSASIQTNDTLKVVLPVATALAPNPAKHSDNLTITGTNLDLAKQVIFTGVTAPVTSFVSQTANQMVIKVPGAAQSGKITFVAASGVQSVSTMDLNILMPTITRLSPDTVDPGSNLTIKGTNLNLVTSVTFQNAPAVTSFVSQADTQIVVTVPMGVLRGNVSLGVLNSTRTVQSTAILEVTGAVPPPTIAFPIYNDAVTANWNGWIGGGWDGTSDRNNASPVREGTKSIRIDYAVAKGYGSPLQLGGGSVDLTPYKTFNISVYGGAGSAGKRITIGINGVNGKFVITLVEGKWTDYAIPLSTLTTETTLKEIWVQEYSGTGGFTVYVDAIGLNP